MTKEDTNNQTSVPDEGQTDEGLVEAEDYDSLTDEELEAKVKGETPEPVKPAPVKETEPITAPADKPDELPDDLKGKSAEELAKAYLNVRKLHAKQDAELGELRKFKEEAENLDKQMKEYQIDTTSRKIVETEIKGMTDEEKQKFYDDFSDDPVKALMPYITKAIKPLAVTTARQQNEAEIQRLVTETKEKRVPYDRKAVDKILASYTKENGRNELFERYGTGAFQEAYNIYYRQNIDAAIEKEHQEFIEKAKKEAEEAALAKSRTYVEPQGVVNTESGAIDFDNVSLDKFDEIVGKPKDY
jgi:hypothetical protein